SRRECYPKHHSCDYCQRDFWTWLGLNRARLELEAFSLATTNCENAGDSQEKGNEGKKKQAEAFI
ncbi:unnamed protein product, partial [Heterotrigona itama]